MSWLGSRQDWYQGTGQARRAVLGSTWNADERDGGNMSSPVWCKHDLLKSLNSVTLHPLTTHHSKLGNGQMTHDSTLGSLSVQKRSISTPPVLNVDSNDNWSHSTIRNLLYGLREPAAIDAPRPRHTSAAKYWDDSLFRQVYGDERQLSGPIPRCFVPPRRSEPKTVGPNYRLASSCMTSWQEDMHQKSFLSYRTDRKRLGKPAQRPLAFMAR